MSIRLVAMDLDDTLLAPGLRLSLRSIQAVRAASAAGIMMTFATNRSFLASKPFVDPLGISGLLITYGGAQTRDAETGDTVSSLQINASLVAEVLDFAARHTMHAHVHQGDAILYETPCAWSGKYAEYVGYAGIPRPSLRLVPPPASKTMILGEPDAISRLLPVTRERFAGRLWVTSSKPWFMELNHPQATKGKALKALCGRLGLNRNEVAAFGDHPEVDRDMIEFAGLGVAMGNAPDSLKAVADLVAPSNADDGVAVVLEKLLAGKITL